MFRLFLLLPFLLACQSTNIVDEFTQKELRTEIICTADECDLFWSRAMFFVSSKAGFKMQIANDYLIETYNPTDYSPKLAYRIQKQPLGNNKHKIITNAWCANLFGCQPNRMQGIANAKRYIRTGDF